MFDAEKFGQEMGAAIREAIAPLQKQLDELKAIKPVDVAEEVRKAFASVSLPKDGKDCDMEAVKAMVLDAVKAIPAPKNGKDADPVDVDAIVERVVKNIPAPKDGTSVTIDDVRPMIGTEVSKAVAAIPLPKDGVGLAGSMIDRDGCLMATLTNGEVKNLGPVVGKDGIGFESFDMEYLPESHEVAIKASAAGRTKELRFPAGGIRPGGYWRDGTKALAAQTWVHDGSMFIALKDTSEKPSADSKDWIIGARRGRDGERGVKGSDGGQPAPIKL
jgi:hypothetical protein